MGQRTSVHPGYSGLRNYYIIIIFACIVMNTWNGPYSLFFSYVFLSKNSKCMCLWSTVGRVCNAITNTAGGSEFALWTLALCLCIYWQGGCDGICLCIGDYWLFYSRQSKDNVLWSCLRSIEDTWIWVAIDSVNYSWMVLSPYKTHFILWSHLVVVGGGGSTWL